MRREFVPRPYQHAMIDFMLSTPRCALWAEPGLGKTPSTLAVLDALRVFDEGPALVVAPLRVAADTWADEAAKWSRFADLRVVPIVGELADRRRALGTMADVYTVNYENVPWLLETVGAPAWPFTTVVADESTKLKGFRLRQGGRRASALGRIAHTKVKRWINLTGTPSANGITDLWGQTWFIDAGARLGRTYSAFEQRWFRKSRDGYSLEPLPYAQEQVHAALRDVCFSLRARDYLDLPEVVHNVIRVELPPKARLLYRDMEREMFATIAGHEVEAFNAASRTIKCLQLANGAAYVGEVDEHSANARPWAEVHTVKLEAVADLVEELSGNPLLVAYHFKPDLTRLARTFPAGVDLATREGMAAFKAGQSPIGFAHPASMGHGVDGLQNACHHLAFFGHWWSLEERLQIIERIGPTRQWQAERNRPVFVHDIVAKGTVDELVIARHESKRSVQEILMEAMRTRE